MGIFSYVHELPDDVVIVHHPALPHAAPRGECGLVEMDRRTVELIDDYSRSCPTGPSAGRCYVKRHGREASAGIEWSDSWTFYEVIDAPADDPLGGRLHHPHEVLIRSASGEEQTNG